jgi:hypothetical protein
MAGTAWNLKKMMEKLKEEFLKFIFQLFFKKGFVIKLLEKRFLRNG